MVVQQEVIIIGSGPAGIAAAIQLKREGIFPLVLEKKRIGGLLVNANLVENYPGFPQGITGLDLVAKMTSHLSQSGINVVYDEVVKVELPLLGKKDHFLQEGHKPPFIVTTTKQKYKSNYLIIASGTKPKEFPYKLPSNVKNKFFYEVFPIRHIEEKKIVIIGGGDAAFDYGLFLSTKNYVIILNRSNNLKALPLLVNRVRKKSKIDYKDETRIISIDSDNSCVKLKIIGEEKEIRIIECDLVVFAIGREPSLDFLSPSLTKNLSTLVATKRLFLIGDVCNKSYRQVAISVGNGIQIGMELARKLSGVIEDEGHC